MNPQLKKLFVACHPDRHGGDHSHMEKFFEASQLPPTSFRALNRCQWPGCGVAVGKHSRMCLVHSRAARNQRPQLQPA